MLELRHLRYFIEVAEELNFSRAAERLHMAQPPLSVAIRQLEQHVDAELFQRTTRGVRLTEAGSAFLEGARRTLAELDRAQQAAQRAAAGDTGQVRVGFSWSARFETLPAIGRAFRLSHPDVSVFAEEMWNARMLPSLRSGAIDAAIALCPEISSECSYLPVRSEPVVALLNESHPRAGEAIELRTLANDAFLMFPREMAPRLYDFMTGLCRGAGFEPILHQDAFHSAWEMDLLADAELVALAPKSAASDLPARVAAAEICDAGGQLQTAIIWRTDDSSAANRAFRDAAQRLFPDPSGAGAAP
jgi:DNA-binding transcriptional LysR family regulator